MCSIYTCIQFNMNYIQWTCNTCIIYTKFLVVHLHVHCNNCYVGSVKLLDWLSVSTDICMQLSTIGLLANIYIGTSLIVSTEDCIKFFNCISIYMHYIHVSNVRTCICNCICKCSYMFMCFIPTCTV